MISSKRLGTALLCSALSQGAVAAFVPSQMPWSQGGHVEPNLMFLLDDSGSMEAVTMPDSLDVRLSEDECEFDRKTKGHSYYICDEDTRRHLFSSAVNTIYYDPKAHYVAPPGLAESSFTAAKLDGYDDTSGTQDLSSKFHMEFYRASGDHFYVGEAGPAFYYQQTSGCANPSTQSCYVRTTVTTDERQNFANWFTYYRSRLMAAKASTANAFDKQTSAIRLGYGSINHDDTVVEGVRAFSSDVRSEFLEWLYATEADGYTPLRKALGDAGEYFSQTDEQGPWSSTPGEDGGTEYSCRQSYTILTTDGYWNKAGASSKDARADADSKNGEKISGPGGLTYQYVPESPFKDGRKGTLADVAMHYWKKDLHPSLANRVPTTADNPAFWQHMVTFGVGLGVSGKIDPAAAFAAVKSGATVTWPDPTEDDGGDAKIDDLLHASVNSRGGYLSAQNPEQFTTALRDTLADISGRAGSSSSATPSARRLDADSLVYEALFSSADWSGKLQAKKPTQTSLGVAFTEEWEAGAKLNSNTSRLLFSHAGGAGADQGVALTWSGLSTEMKAHFNDSEALFDYLMGKRNNEAPAGLKYRKRGSLLGDIVNSTIVIANKQNWGFHNRVPTPSGGQDYDEFFEEKAAGTPMLFVGANDGFLHGFNADSGQELFAYMPSGVLPNVKELASTDYSHRYYVDGALHVRDAVLDGEWRTVLLGGLGAGGKTVFALDVTDAASQSGFEADKVLWEIKDDDDLGHNFGEPLVGRTKDGKWVAIFGNGYGSANEDSVLFIVDLATGSVNKVRAGTDTGGLSSPSFVYGRDELDGSIYIENVYAGDLKGNLWRFSLEEGGTGADDFEVSLTSGNAPQPLYIAADTKGNPQPITVKPEIAFHPEGEDLGYMIYFGTGRLYTTEDLADTSSQAFYGIWDERTADGDSIAFTGLSKLEASTVAFEGSAFGKQVRALDAPSTINWKSKRGWYLTLPTQRERVIFSPNILLHRLVFETAIPSTDLCLGGGTGWTMAVDLATGGGLSKPIFDMNGDGKFDDKDTVKVNGEDLPVSGIGDTDEVPTGSYDLFSEKKYWLCRGTGTDACVEMLNPLKVTDGRQSWSQTQ